MALKTLVQKENKNARTNPRLTRKTRNKKLIEQVPVEHPCSHACPQLLHVRPRSAAVCSRVMDETPRRRTPPAACPALRRSPHLHNAPATRPSPASLRWLVSRPPNDERGDAAEGSAKQRRQRRRELASGTAQSRLAGEGRGEGWRCGMIPFAVSLSNLVTLVIPAQSGNPECAGSAHRGSQTRACAGQRTRRGAAGMSC